MSLGIFLWATDSSMNFDIRLGGTGLRLRNGSLISDGDE